MNARAALAACAAWLPAAGLLLARPANWPHLPERMPTHWPGLGRPDGFSSATEFWLTLLVAAVAAGLAGTAGLLRARRAPAAGRVITVWSAAAGGLVLGIWVASASSVPASGMPEDAVLGPRILWLLLAPVCAWPAWMAGRPARLRAAAGVPAPAMPRIAWATSIGSRATAVVLVTAAAVAAVLAVSTEPLLWAVAVLPLALLAGAFGRFRVTVDRRGLRVTGSPLPLPLVRIPLAEVAEVRAERIDPLRWGGWGFRVMPGRSALVLRAGPGLVVVRRDGRAFAVTLPHPEAPAALLADLAARYR